MSESIGPWAIAADESHESAIARHVEASRQESSLYRGRTMTFDSDNGSELRLVGGVGGTVMGSLIARQDSARRWHIVHLYVEPDAREVGIGDALLRMCLDQLRVKGADFVGGQALPGDRSMKNLFERHGLVAQTILVGKSLSDPSSAGHVSR